MKRRFVISSIASSALLVGGFVAFSIPSVEAAPVSNLNTLVFVGQDVTRQLDYTITYTDYTQTGVLLWSKTIPAPPGSLIRVQTMRLSKTIAANEPYVVVQSTPAQQRTDITELHEQIAQSITSSETATATTIPVMSPDSTMVATGSFNTYHSAYADYSITYNNDTADGSLNVTHYSLWLSSTPSSTLYWNWIDWANNEYVPGCPMIGLSSDKDSVSLAWSGGTGNKFTTDINDSSACNEILGTDYQGWVILN